MIKLLVDGDNVTRVLGLTRLPQVEEFLLRLEMAALSKDWEAIVVFDGPERFLPREEGPLVVRYGMGRTADSVIERMAYEAPDKIRLVVVTQDRAEADLVRGFGAVVWNAQRLQEEMGSFS